MDEPQENLAPTPKENLDKEVEDLEENPPLFKREDFKEFHTNTLWFLRFYLDILAEKPEAESYPAFFLPALSMVTIFTIALAIGFYKILLLSKTPQIFVQPIALTEWWQIFLIALVLSIFGMLGFLAGLRISSFIFKGSVYVQDIVVIGGIFCFPLITGLFLAWLLSYSTMVIGVLILFLSHALAIVGMYAALPRTMLLKGISRFLTILISIASSVLSIGILLRILMTM